MKTVWVFIIAIMIILAGAPQARSQNWTGGAGGGIKNTNLGPVRIGVNDEEAANRFFVGGHVGISQNTQSTASQLNMGYTSDSPGYGFIYAKDWIGLAYKNLILNASGGNVGIRTTSATHPLTVAGQIKSTTGGFVLPDGTVIDAADDIGGGIWTDGATYTHSPTGYNVGIGIMPQTKLHVNGSVRGNQNGALRIDSGNGWVDVGAKNSSEANLDTDRLKFVINKELRVDSGYIGSYNENLFLRTSGATRMTILNSNGNVGIGTVGPSHPLTVAGAIKSTTGGFVLPDATVIDDQGDLNRLWTVAGSDIYRPVGKLGIGGAPTHPLTVAGAIRSTTGGFVLPDATVIDEYSDVERWGINGTKLYYNSGYVGLGTSAPAEQLDVAGKVRASQGFVLPDNTLIVSADDMGQWTVGGQDVYRSSGKVGIGTTTPVEQLDVVGKVKASEGFVLPDNTLIISADDMGPWTVGGQDVYRSSGKVGIGTTTPVEQLDVAGRVRASLGFVLPDSTLVDSADDMGQWTVSGQNVYRNTGYVGIGTTAPQSPLSVNGTITAEEVVVEAVGADFVFADDYALIPLSDLKQTIKQHRHLPGIPSATDFESNGMRVGEMQTRLLQKIEELTLYVIDLNERMALMQKENATTSSTDPQGGRQ